MKRKLRPHAATVIAALALFVALGGTSAAVTGGTPFTTHQISGSQLADRSVPGTKLENHTVTAQQLNLNGLPTVPSATFAGDASLATTAETAQTAKTATTAGTITGTISGSQVSSAVANATSAENANTAATAGTITGTISGSQVAGAVANATNATNATNAANAASATTATTATNATNATNVDGDQLSNVSEWSGSSTDTTLVHTAAGLTLAMRCTGGNVDIDATTSTSSASLGMSDVTNAGATGFVKAEGTFNTGNTLTTTSTAPAQIDLSYEQNGEVSSGTLTVFDDAGTCAAFGVIESSG